MVAPAVMKAVAFLNMIGVCTHLPYTDGGYANVANVAADLQYLSVSNVRDGLTEGQNGSAPFSTFVGLAQQGVRFTLVSYGDPTTDALGQQVANVANLQQAVPGSVTALEGLNEINNAPVTYNGLSGLAAAVHLQRDLYSFVKGNTVLGQTPVAYFTGYGTDVGVGPDPEVRPLADYDNQHPYPRQGQPPSTWIDPAAALTNEPTAGPFVYTETGYSTYGTGMAPDVVDQSSQAIYTLDLLMDAAFFGASQVYLYQLLDAYAPGSPQGDDGFGLFDEFNNPKQAAVALHNLSAILQDTGATAATFAPAPLAYTLVSMPQGGRSLLLAKSNGVYDLVLWNEQPVWNATTKSDMTPLSATVSVRLGAKATRLALYDPLVGPGAIATAPNSPAGHLDVTLPGHPVIVEITP